MSSTTQYLGLGVALPPKQRTTTRQSKKNGAKGHLRQHPATQYTMSRTGWRSANLVQSHPDSGEFETCSACLAPVLAELTSSQLADTEAGVAESDRTLEIKQRCELGRSYHHYMPGQVQLLGWSQACQHVTYYCTTHILKLSFCHFPVAIRGSRYIGSALFWRARTWCSRRKHMATCMRQTEHTRSMAQALLDANADSNRKAAAQREERRRKDRPDAPAKTRKRKAAATSTPAIVITQDTRSSSVQCVYFPLRLHTVPYPSHPYLSPLPITTALAHSRTAQVATALSRTVRSAPSPNHCSSGTTRRSTPQSWLQAIQSRRFWRLSQ